jgi:hypothetical protein
VADQGFPGVKEGGGRFPQAARGWILNTLYIPGEVGPVGLSQLLYIPGEVGPVSISHVELHISYDLGSRGRC